MKFHGLHIIFLSVLLAGCYAATDTLVLEASDKNLELNNGVLLYNETPFSGTLVSYYNSESLKSKIEYVDGKKHGYERQWYLDESIQLERVYNEGLKVGIHKAWWPSGDLKFEYHFNNDGEFHGNVKEWFQSGKVFRDFNYDSGKEVGLQRMWKIDGRIKANYEVVNGERFGLIGLKKCYTVTVDKNEIE